MRRCIFFALVLCFANPLLGQDETPADSVAATLTAAKTDYRTVFLTASQSLLDEIDERITRTENNFKMSVETQLALLKDLAAQRKAFQADHGDLPTYRGLKAEVSKYNRKLRQARSTMEDAFDDAADAYRKPPLKNFSAAAKVLKERETFFDEIPIPEIARSEITFNGRNWSVSDPKMVEITKDQLRIAATSDGNLVLTGKSDYQSADIVAELAAETGTEAFVILNAKKIDGEWTGVTSRIHFENGKVIVGGLNTGFRPNKGNQRKFRAGEFFQLRLHIRPAPKVSSNKAMAHNWIDGKNVLNRFYPWSETNRSGSMGFMVTKGSLLIKELKVSDETAVKAGPPSVMDTKGKENALPEIEFGGENWILSAPKHTKVEEDRLTISASPKGNIVFTKKSDYQNPNVVIELAAAEETDAFILLNAQKTADGRWTGVTSRILFNNGKIIAGGHTVGFRPDLGNKEKLGVDDDFSLRLSVVPDPKDSEKAVIQSWLNGDSTAEISYGWKYANRTGPLGFIVTQGSLSVKTIAVTEK